MISLIYKINKSKSMLTFNISSMGQGCPPTIILGLFAPIKFTGCLVCSCNRSEIIVEFKQVLGTSSGFPWYNSEANKAGHSLHLEKDRFTTPYLVY